MEIKKRLLSERSPRPERGGLHIVFEGIDGSGKSTQCKLLEQKLLEEGWAVIRTCEPTHTGWGKKLRDLAEAGKRLPPQEELEWFVKDRKQHLKQVVLPALLLGKIVLQDRYFYSTAAYQGSRGLSPQKIIEQHEAFAPEPDSTIIIQIDTQESLRRIKEERGDLPNAFEKRDSLQKCADVFDSLQHQGVSHLDGKSSQEQLQKQVQTIVFAHLSG